MIPAIVAFTHDPDLISLVQAQLDATFDGDDYFIRPDPGDVVADAMATACSDIRDTADDLVRCVATDECLAEAIVLRRFADWIEGEL